MATAKITKKDMQQDEFIEGVFDFGEWIEAHWQRVAIGLGVAVAFVLLLVGWNAMRERSREEANRLLAEGMAAFSPAAGADGAVPAPRYAEALPLFEQAASAGGSRPIGDVARLYRARTLMALSRGAEAVTVLEGLQSLSDKGLQADAKVTLASALESTGNADRAATLLRELAAPSKDAVYPQDAALMHLGRLLERQGKTEEAKRVFSELLMRYPQSSFANDARQRGAS